MTDDARYCPICGAKARTRGGHSSASGSYTRYKVCEKGHTFTTQERRSQDIEKSTT